MPEFSVADLTDIDQAFLLGWFRRACPAEWAVATAALEQANAAIAERMAARAAVSA